MSSGSGDFTLTGSEQEQFQLLNNQFKRTFGHNFGDFSFEAYLNDTDFATNIDNRADQLTAQGNTAAAQSLKNLLDFFKGRTGGPDDFIKIDQTSEFADRRQRLGTQFADIRAQVPEFFDPARENVAKQAGLAKVSGQLAINENFAGASDRAAEAAAAGGLGRTGVNIASQIGLSQRAASSRSKLDASINEQQSALQAGIDDKEAGLKVSLAQQELGQNLKLDFQEFSFNLEQELKEQGWDLKLIDDRMQFERELFQLNFQAELAANAQEESHWWDDGLGLIQLGIRGYEAYVSGGASEAVPTSTG